MTQNMIRPSAVVLVGLATTALVGCPRPPSAPAAPPGERTIESPFLDTRLQGSPVTLLDAPPPISGGTLTVSGTTAIVADPDRDRLLVVDLTSETIDTVALPPESEPGRVVVDPGARVHVVLRGAGAIYSFPVEAPARGTQREVCPQPRGLAFDATSELLVVACRGGELVALPPSGGAATSTARVEGGDLRDVVIRGEEIWVSRFRAAELVHVALDGTVLGRIQPTSTTDPFSGSVDSSGTFREAVFRPSIAWRTALASDGAFVMVHQRASDAELQTAPGAYYSSSLCNGSVVQSAVTFFDEGGATDAPNLADASLMVDVAINESGEVAVVNAGNQSGYGALQVYSREFLSTPADTFGGGCVGSYGGYTMPSDLENAVAVAWAPGGRLVVQQREPSQLVVLNLRGGVEASRVTLPLGGEPRFDTGHALFHGNASRGTACASCHPEGGEDGRTWVFAGIGPRRTPAMHAGFMDTAPFHWDGDLADLSSLMDVVFTGRMSGPHVTQTEVAALGDWLDQLPPVAPSRPSDEGAVARGGALYWGEAQCGTCHSGVMLTNNATSDVGTGGAFQVPSLVGVSLRLPVMHDGCATTLEQRFEPRCGGGDMHGRTSHLTPEQISDLVSFLQTL